jgi:hypothetical protein
MTVLVRASTHKLAFLCVAGDRKYKVPVLDPLEIQELKIADSGPRQVGLTLAMTNAKVFGMKNSELKVTR